MKNRVLQEMATSLVQLHNKKSSTSLDLDAPTGESEKNAPYKRRRNKITRSVIAVFAAIGCMVSLLYMYNGSQYQQAVDLALNQEYNEAKLLANMISYDNDKLEGLHALCDALKNYDDGNMQLAAEKILVAEALELNDEQEIKLQKIKVLINNAYEYSQLSEKEREAIERYANKYPQVGMEEEYLNCTLLGTAEYVGKRYAKDSTMRFFEGDCYCFYSSEWVVLRAYCEKGIVTHIEDLTDDKRYSSEEERAKAKKAEATTQRTVKSKTTKKSTENDPYNAADYYNAEDFYEYHYYSFADYYDAEKYYREHSD